MTFYGGKGISLYEQRTTLFLTKWWQIKGFMEPATINKQPLPKLIQPQYFLYGLNFLSILFLVSQTVYSEPTNIMQTIIIFPCAVS